MRISDWSSDVCSSDLLVQATDQWVGVRPARLVLLDDLGLRGAVAAFWLRQLGYDVAVARLDEAMRRLTPLEEDMPLPTVASVPAATALEADRGQLVDLRGSSDYRKAHVAGARRSEEHTSELQSLLRISYAVFCLKHKNSTT